MPADAAAVCRLASATWDGAKAKTRSTGSDGACRSWRRSGATIRSAAPTNARSTPCAGASPPPRSIARSPVGAQTPLPRLSLHDLGEGARDAALDRPQRHRPQTDAQAGSDAGGSGRGEAAGARVGNGDGRRARHRAGVPARPLCGRRRAHGVQHRLRCCNSAWPAEQRGAAIRQGPARLGENHREWFHCCEPPAPAIAKAMRPDEAGSRPAIHEGPPPPRHSPTF
jgi:hypothetical protein